MKVTIMHCLLLPIKENIYFIILNDLTTTQTSCAHLSILPQYLLMKLKIPWIKYLLLRE